TDPGGLARSVVFAVLGGVASGKSTVARLLAGNQGVILSADAYAHEVLEAGDTRAWLVERFGPQVLGADGRVDRPWLAKLVFGQPELRKALEDWIHPRVRARIWSDLAGARAQAVPRIVLDVPLLMESDALQDLRQQIDHLVFVDVPLEERERRAGAQRGWEPGEVARREAAQMPLLEKRKAASWVLDASGTLEQLTLRVQDLLQACGL
ncbi:MAG TPA: dephospho-CoA kinase, partial [Planctomycetota bacterium]|nr:dephospho-CoA kinase [Planctomycetota bacterium]